MSFSAKKFSENPKFTRNSNSGASALVTETESKHASAKGPIQVVVHGFTLEIDTGVFNPSFSNIGDLLARHMNILPGEFVLDFGTGSGIQALVAAKTACQVIATDKQVEAVACAIKNVRRNGLTEKIKVLCGDLFDPLPDNCFFDTIISNFPFVPWKPETAWQHANFDYEHRSLRKFLQQAKQYLKPTGRIVMTWSDLGDTDYFLGLAAELDYNVGILVERKVAEVNHFVFQLKINEK